MRLRRAFRIARSLVVYGALFALLAAGVDIALAAAGRASFLVSVPPGPLPAWVAGPLAGLEDPMRRPEFFTVVLVMWGCYAIVLAAADTLRPRVALTVVVAVHASFLLAPPLLSTDIFSYLDYARLGALHGLDPYAHTPFSGRHDAAYAFVGSSWRHVPTVYGPLFTLTSYPLALLGLGGALWGLKALTASASVACVALVWRCARLLGRDPLRPALTFGLNPLLLVYVVGGGHNDMLMMALMIAGVALALTERERLGASAVVAAAAVKASAVAVLPFMALGATRRRTAMVGAMLGFAVCALVAVLAFGKDGWTFLAVLEKQQRLVATDSFPDMVAQLLGLPGVAAGVRFAAYLALGACGLALSAAVWRGADWVTASGWMLLTLAVTTTFLVPWYTVWALPFAAISGSRRLLVATLAVEALYFAHQLAPLFA